MNYPPIPFAPVGIAKEAAGRSAILEYLLKRKGGAGQGAARWLARQTYATTGWLPGMSKLRPTKQVNVLKAIRAGAPGAKAEIAAATKELGEARRLRAKGLVTDADVASKMKGVGRARAEAQWAKLTGGTLPGTVRAMFRSPGQVLRSGWGAMQGWEKAMFGGLGAKGLYDVYSTPVEAYGQEGMPGSRLEHLGRELGGNLGWVATGGLPILPMIAASTATEQAGALPGKLMAPQSMA